MTRAIHLTGGRQDWETPAALIRELELWFFAPHDRFELDVAATAENAKAPRFITIAENALVQQWRGRCWMNPPYGRNIGAWVEKAEEEARTAPFASRTSVVCLLPARTDTSWFHDIVLERASSVHFIRGRLRFGDKKGPTAPFPSMIVYFQHEQRMGAVTPTIGGRFKAREDR